ncbi:MAG: CinA family protein [Hyphomonas oceanitis]|uniref:CinA family protein n=1 Tax=Hyphomonas oceanitis TaxID=81033 RepID=UPI00300246A1
MFPDRLRNLAMLILDDAEQARLKICTAESCTGGLLAALFTDIPGSSSVFERGFVTYSNRAKEEMLGIAGDVLADYGAVSEPVARMMAEGALEASRANIAVAITGVAGPGGGTRMKPVGTVHIACVRENRAVVHEMIQVGEISRQDIRMAAVETALNLIQVQMR